MQIGTWSDRQGNEFKLEFDVQAGIADVLHFDSLNKRWVIVDTLAGSDLCAMTASALDYDQDNVLDFAYEEVKHE